MEGHTGDFFCSIQRALDLTLPQTMCGLLRMLAGAYSVPVMTRLYVYQARGVERFLISSDSG
jgi:hypothetical protein